MYRFMNGLVVGLGLMVLTLPSGARAASGQAQVEVALADDGAALDALIAAIDAAATPVITDGTAEAVLLDEGTAGVSAETGVVTAEGFTAQLNLRDDLGLLVATEYALVAPNGDLQFTVSPTTLLMPTTGFTLEVLRADSDTNAISVVSALSLAPLVLTCSTDSVSQTVIQTIARGSITEISNLLAIGLETGGLSAAEIAALRAAIAQITATAAGAAARQTVIAAAQRAAQYALSTAPRGSAAFNAARGAIMNALFKYGYQPAVNAFTIAVMRDYIAQALANIRLYQDRLRNFAGVATPQQMADWQRQIDLQNGRISQIMAWMTANNVNP